MSFILLSMLFLYFALVFCLVRLYNFHTQERQMKKKIQTMCSIKLLGKCDLVDADKWQSQLHVSKIIVFDLMRSIRTVHIDLRRVYKKSYVIYRVFFNGLLFFCIVVMDFRWQIINENNIRFYFCCEWTKRCNKNDFAIAKYVMLKAWYTIIKSQASVNLI